MQEIRLVVDTNLWISFLLIGSYAKLQDLMSRPGVVLLVSQELLDELSEVASRPKFVRYNMVASLADMLAFAESHFEFVDPVTEVTVCRDPKDNFLLSLSLDGNASHLLTGDKDLLVLNPFYNINIQSISNFLASQ